MCLVCFLNRGKAGPVDKGMKDQMMAAKRENTELNNRIKQLENELRRGGREKSTVGGTDDVGLTVMFTVVCLSPHTRVQ